MSKRGRKPTPEEMAIHELCLDYWVNQGWSHAQIARYLFKKHGITHAEDPTQPVHRTTVMRYIRGAAERMDKEQRKRQGIEKTVATQELDGLREFLYTQRQDANGEFLRFNLEETGKFIEYALKILDRRVKLLVPDEPVKTIAEVTHHGEVDLPGLDPKTAKMLKDLQNMIDEEHALGGPPRRAGYTASNGRR